MKKATSFAAVAAFVVGVLLQPVLEQLFSHQLKDTTKLEFLMALLVVVSLLVAGDIALALHKDGARRLTALTSAVRQLDAHLGLRVQFLLRGPAGTAGDPYTIVKWLIDQAESEVLVLDHRPANNEDRFGSNTSLEDPSRAEYYRLLTNRVTRALPDGRFIRYRRVVQLQSGATARWESAANGDRVFADHVRAIVSTRATVAQCPSAIMTSGVFFPNASMVVIDRKLVLLELAINGLSGDSRVEGDLVFHDPQGVLATPLQQLFENIDSQSTLVTEVS